MMTAATLHPAVQKRGETDRLAWHPDGWYFRGVAVALALAVSCLFAICMAQPFGTLGVVTLIGAGLAWPTLLAVVWFLSDPLWRFARLDWCLWAMTVGSVVMAMGLCTYFVRLVLWIDLPAPELFLLGGLLTADVAMCFVLTRCAPSVGVSRTAAALMWIAGMNGFLLTILMITHLIIH